MKLRGWIFMTLSWGSFIGMAIFCFSRIFKKGIGGENFNAIKQQETGDTDAGNNMATIGVTGH